MTKLYSYLVETFTTKSSSAFAFGVICLWGTGLSVLIILSSVEPRPVSPVIMGIQTVNTDINLSSVPIPIETVAEPAVIETKVIYVSIKDQTLVYLEGDKIIGEFRISSGVYGSTPQGEYTVLKKKPVVHYKGANYNYPGTKWNLMFKTGNPLNYYIHGAYWHHNFGNPMSHGCINVSYANMEELYNWADEGTKIIIANDTLSALLPNTNLYPTPPGGNTAKATDNSITVSWNPATDPIGVAGYQIYLNGIHLATTTKLKYEISGLTPETLYQLAIYSYNQSGYISVQPEQLSITTSPAP